MEPSTAGDYMNQSLLHWAAWNGDTDKMRFLLSTGVADVDNTDRFGVTPLFVVAWNGDTEMARLLLTAGADARTVLNYTDQTLLHPATVWTYRNGRALLNRRR